MSQTNTYRPQQWQEAVMTPASEVAPSPLPAAQASERTPQQRANNSAAPARRSNASIALEQLRNQSRRIATQNVTWIPVQSQPIDGGAGQGVSGQQRMLQASETPLTRRGTVSRGAALSTLMRSAARQYTPAPPLRTPPSAPALPAGPPMRGALRSVVRQAQGNGSHPVASRV